MAKTTTICDEDWQAIIDAISAANIINTLTVTVGLVDFTNCPRNSLRKSLSNMDSKLESY